MLLSFSQASAADAGDRLVVIWTSGDPEVAEKVCFMYTLNARLRGWFADVTLVVWGPSARLLSESQDLQRQLKDMMEAGVRVEACVTCADMYGVSPVLRELGIEVKGMGAPLTEYLKSGARVLSF